MKLVKVIFEDNEHEKLLIKKGDLTWKEFILQLSEDKNDN